MFFIVIGLKRNEDFQRCTTKWKKSFIYCSLTSFQICVTFFLLWNTKEVILLCFCFFFYSIVWTKNTLNIFFCVPQKECHTMPRQTFNFWENHHFNIECALNVVVNIQLLWYSIAVEAMTMTGRPMADERIQLHTLTILAFRGVLKSRALTGWQTAM